MTIEQKETVKKLIKRFSIPISLAILGVAIVLFFFTNVFGNNEVTPEKMSAKIERKLNDEVNVFYSESVNTYQMTVKSEELHDAIDTMFRYDTVLEEFSELSDSVVELSLDVTKDTGTPSAIMLMDPTYPEYYILLVSNGNIIYTPDLDSY